MRSELLNGPDCNSRRNRESYSPAIVQQSLGDVDCLDDPLLSSGMPKESIGEQKNLRVSESSPSEDLEHEA